MLKILASLWVKWLKYVWSTWRYRNSIKGLDDDYSEYIPATIFSIKKLATELYERFSFKMDGLYELFDAIDSPASCWQKAFTEAPLEDDCDGFHAALYWAASFNFDCRLFTVVVNNIINSHTILCVKHDCKYFYLDYTFLSVGFDSMDELLEHIYNRRYRPRNLEIIAHELSYWDQKWISRSWR